jgi:hypothetical protein
MELDESAVVLPPAPANIRIFITKKYIGKINKTINSISKLPVSYFKNAGSLASILLLKIFGKFCINVGSAYKIPK